MENQKEKIKERIFEIFPFCCKNNSNILFRFLSLFLYKYPLATPTYLSQFQSQPISPIAPFLCKPQTTEEKKEKKITKKKNIFKNTNTYIYIYKYNI